MTEEFDDLESSDQETPETPAPSGLPEWAKEQVSQANREAQGLRKRLKERETEILASKFEGYIELLPDEVTSYDAKVAFLEKLKTKFDSAPATPEPTENSEAAPTPAEEPTDEEKNLAAVAKGPSGATPGTLSYSEDEIIALAFSDPARYKQLRDSGALPPPQNPWGPDK